MEEGGGRGWAPLGSASEHSWLGASLGTMPPNWLYPHSCSFLPGDSPTFLCLSHFLPSQLRNFQYPPVLSGMKVEPLVSSIILSRVELAAGSGGEAPQSLAAIS